MRPRDSSSSDLGAPSPISAELVESYTRAVYRIDASPEPIFLRVGEVSSALGRRLAAGAASSFAFLSAANPGSVALCDAENQRRHERLVERLGAADLPVIAGESYEGTSGGWREASLLVVGIDRETARALAREFGQVALLFGEAGGPVELLLTAGEGNSSGS